MFPLDRSVGCMPSCGAANTGKATTDFHTRLRLLGEAHDHEIRLLQQSHAQELQAVQDENARLRLLGEACEHESRLLQQNHTRGFHTAEDENKALRRTLQIDVADDLNRNSASAASCPERGREDDCGNSLHVAAEDQSHANAHHVEGSSTRDAGQLQAFRDRASTWHFDEVAQTVTREANGLDMTPRSELAIADGQRSETVITSNISAPLGSETVVTSNISAPLGLNDVDVLDALTSFSSVLQDADSRGKVSDDEVPAERNDSADPTLFMAHSTGSRIMQSVVLSRPSTIVCAASTLTDRASTGSAGVPMSTLRSMDSDAPMFPDPERAKVNWMQVVSAVLTSADSEVARLHAIWHSCAGKIKDALRTQDSFFGAASQTAEPRSSGNRNSMYLYRPIATKMRSKHFTVKRRDSLTGGGRFSASRFSMSVLKAQMPVIWSCGQTLACIRRHTIMKPGCKLRLFWDFLCVMWCSHDFFMFPLQLINSLESDDYQSILTLAQAVFWTMDIFMSISTGYYTPEGNTEMNRRRIMIAYATSWLPLDLPVVLVDWYLLITPTSDLSKLSFFTRLVRMARLLRVVKLCPKVWDFIGQINSENIYTFAQLLSYIFLIILVNHYIACGLYGTWSSVGTDTDFAEGYLRSLHWALAHSTLGSMDIYPKSIFERLWTCIVLVLSMVIFSTFLSSITNSIAHLRSLRQERIRQERMVRSFFADNDISRELAAQVWNFIWRSELVKKHRTRESEVQIFRILPIHMRVEIKLETFLPFLLQHPLFCRLNEIDPEAMVKLCDRGIEQMVLHAQQELNWPEDHVSRMVFVTGGSVVYMPFYDPSNSIVLHRNNWACEETLWSSSAQLTGPFIGGPQGADLMLVVPEQFREISRSFTTCCPLLVKYAAVFIERFNSACLDEEYTDLLFNNVQQIESMLMDAEAENVNANARFSQGTKRNIMKSVFHRLESADFDT